MSASDWIAKSLNINDFGELVIDVEPACGNRKQWQGEMLFEIPPGAVSELVRQAEEHTRRQRMIEIAKAELKEFLGGVKVDYQEKKTTLAGKLTLSDQDMPSVLWWTMDSADGDIGFFR